MRLDGLSENQFDTSVANVLKQVGELKKRQLVGSRSLVILYTKTNNTWDVDETVSGSQLLAQWRVTFTPDTVARPHTEISYEFLVTPDSGFELGAFDAYPDPADITGDVINYLVDYSNPNLSDVNVKLKFGFKSSDTGTITWQRLAGV